MLVQRCASISSHTFGSSRLRQPLVNASGFFDGARMEMAKNRFSNCSRAARWSGLYPAEQPANLGLLRKFAQGLPGCGSRPCGREPPLVEAGGQHIHGFRRGLDYAFIRLLTSSERMRSVLSD